MGLMRSGGQILYDLAIKQIDEVIGSRERYAAFLYSRYIENDNPTSHFIRVFNNTWNHSMVSDNPISFCSAMSRIATVEMLASGIFDEIKTNTNEGRRERTVPVTP